ncbi:GNAT family N-acetyltransferase [Sporosarcina sp. NPDC096371]|uniref:GNAT family N-acetyltransferase n=1 Tax=Sporosarcina sp. NPDC096371 TaxID=3364530 RepID=UPI003808D2EF
MIYYNDDHVLIRSMIKSDIQEFVDGFAEQQWDKPVKLFYDYYCQQEKDEKSVIIAEVNGEVAGYVTLLPNATNGPYAHKNIPEIVDFNVLIKFQKRGIGNKMMDVAESIAQKHSEFVSFAVGLHYGYGSAQRMYVKRGYIPDGTGVWYQDEQLEQYVKCENDDDLVLYFHKKLDVNE